MPCSPLNSVHCIVASSGVSLWSFSKAEIPLIGAEDSPFVKKPYFHCHPERCHKSSCLQESTLNS